MPRRYRPHSVRPTRAHTTHCFCSWVTCVIVAPRLRVGPPHRVACRAVQCRVLNAGCVPQTHDRWATHGPPNEVNCHPHQSNAAKEFTVVHNGIITNSNSLRALLERKGYTFVSDTDTESIAVLCQYIFDEKSKVCELKCNAPPSRPASCLFFFLLPSHFAKTSSHPTTLTF